MPAIELYGITLAAGLGLTGLGLLAWQWTEVRRRETGGSSDDESHFARQDVRRWLVAGVMILLSAGVFCGSRMEPRLGGRPNLLFLQTWLWVVVLVLALLVLALLDFVATRRYARRQRHALLREGMEIFREGFKVLNRRPPGGEAGKHPEGGESA